MTLVAPEISGQTLIESMGGTAGTAAAARLSVGSNFASSINVAYLCRTT